MGLASQFAAAWGSLPMREPKAASKNFRWIGPTASLEPKVTSVDCPNPQESAEEGSFLTQSLANFEMRAH